MLRGIIGYEYNDSNNDFDVYVGVLYLWASQFAFHCCYYWIVLLIHYCFATEVLCIPSPLGTVNNLKCRIYGVQKCILRTLKNGLLYYFIRIWINITLKLFFTSYLPQLRSYVSLDPSYIENILYIQYHVLIYYYQLTISQASLQAIVYLHTHKYILFLFWLLATYTRFARGIILYIHYCL